MTQKTILAVDDSSIIRNMVYRTLTANGYKVDLAEDGRKAAEMGRLKAYDLLITDINMPELDGFGLARVFKQLPKNRNTPIICLTTESSQQSKEKGRSLGVAGWMVKPFSPETLTKVAVRYTV